MIVVIEFLFMILIIASCLTIKFKFKQENSIVITFLSLALLMYLLGLFDIMKVSLYIIIILDLLGLGFIIYSFIKKQVRISDLFTLGTLIYIVVALILGGILRNTYLTAWDEFSHWGANLKAMVANDLFWSNAKYDGIHVVYQPLAGIIEYWFCKLNGAYLDSIAYTAIDIAILTLLIPILKDLKYDIKDIVKGIMFIFIVDLLIFIFNYSLTSIYIDLILGIMFAIGMFCAINGKELEDKILSCIIVISMAELKTTGLLLAGIILIVLFFKNVFFYIIEEKKINKKIISNFLKLIGILVLIIIFYLSWNLYCKSNGRVLDKRHDNNFISEINIKEFVKAVIQYNCTDEKLLSISRSFYKALNEQNIISGFPFGTCIQILVILDIVTLLLFTKLNDDSKKKSLLSRIIGI